MSSLIQSPADELALQRRPAEAATLVELLRLRALEDADRTAYTFLLDGEQEETTLTYGELDGQARRIGAWLQAIGGAGERVLLLYPPGLEFIAAFFGCLYAGAVAVPAYPPRRNRNLLRLQSLVADAGAAAALTTETILSRITPQLSADPLLGSLRWLASDAVAEGVAGDWEGAWVDPRVTPESLAFLQYTSGSTSAPKGVMVSHGNILHNERLIQRAFRQTARSTIVGWLPVYHDMGLIGNVIQPLYVGAKCVMMSPVAFLQSPLRWLQAVTRYRATTSGGPNFAYDLCAHKVTAEQRETLDLSSWQVAFNGAEPIRPETLERFSRTFASCGFRREAFLPCYGLAEATLLVTGSWRDAPPRVERMGVEGLETHRVVEAAAGDDKAVPLVGCGEATDEQELLIVHPETGRMCAPDQVGEIWVAGRSVARGYWNRPEETERTFGARLAGTGAGPFLRTGDLGFLKDGELFITGRLKDLIIIRGLNHYPQDIEQTVEKAHGALRPGGGAAFSVAADDGEQLVVVQEADARGQFEPDAIFASVKESLARAHELQAHAVALIKPGSLPKTSSGKVQRHAARRAFLEGKLDVLAEWRVNASSEPEAAPTTARAALVTPPEFEAWLRTLLARKLSADEQTIDTAQPISRYGMDSLAAIELMHRVEAETGVQTPFSLFLGDTSIAELAAYLSARRGDAATAPQAVAAIAAAAASTTAAHAGDHAAEHPLTYGQRALWFLYRMSPESAAYNLTNAARFVSPVDIEALRRSFRHLIARHASLRATFGERDEQPVQRIHEAAEVDFRVRDAVSLSDDALGELLDEEARRPFDLERGPLFRVSLYRRAAGEHVMQVSMHHIVADFWSMAVLMHELGVLYAAEVAGETPALNPLADTYTDYARRQEEALRGEEGERLYRFWHEQLSGELPVLNFPIDRARPSVQTFEGASEFFRLDAKLTAQVREYARTRGATLYVTLLAAFQTLLHRYTEQTDIIVGSPTADRNGASSAGLVGYFVNPVVLRSDLSGDPTFAETLERVKRTALAAFEHQSYPFPLLVERLQPERDAARSPLFQTMFILQKSHLRGGEDFAAFALGEAGARLNLSGLSVEAVSLDQRIAQFDLTITLAETGDELRGAWQYNTGLFDAATISRLSAHFETLLRSAVSEPQQPISTLPLLTAPESHRLLVEWNDTTRAYPSGESIHQLFAAQVARTPDALALVGADQTRLTYRQLDARAQQLARHLRARGVRPETLVGVYLHRSPQMVVALLGVLKAGGAYVPLDPAYPKARLEFILDDAQAALVLTQESLVGTLPDGAAANALCLDTQWAKIVATSHGDDVLAADGGMPVADGDVTTADEDVLDASVLAGNLAYIIYTSGSTGRPKGVAITHGNAVTLLHWARENFSPADLRGVLAATSICFDLSVFELFVPLSWGGSVILADNALQLPMLAAKDEVTLINTVPSVMTELLRMGGVPDGVRIVNLAGEALPARLAREIHRQLDAAELINLYGPSEDTTYSTMVRLGREETAAQPPIGRPIANTQAYVLDRNLEPVPVGVAGEVYLSGDGLARGYLNRPELTAERFMPHPHAARPGARLYKTGDVGRYLADGQLDYLGRADHQVKVRGFRIELGEVETALCEHASVRESVCTVREETTGVRRLVAYVVGAHAVSAGELIEHLRGRLPEYMVPHAFVMLAALPLTPNGKLDRRALPAPEYGVAAGAESVEASTAAEASLCEIWQEVLGTQRVGIHDNFFELGGDSILSVQIISKAAKVGLHFTLRQLFQHQTVAELAAVAGAASVAAEAEQGTIVGAAPLTPVQSWFFETEPVDPHHFNQALLLEVKETLDAGLLERAVAHLSAHHDALRLRFERTAGGWRQFNAESAPQGYFQLADISGMDEAARSEAIADAAARVQSGFDLSRGPLFKVVLFDAGAPRAGRLLLVAHHLVVDGVSWRILLDDLQTAYRQLSRGEEITPGLKTGAFKQWAERLVEYARSGKAEANYWLDALAPGAEPLPVDRDGENTVASAGTVSVELDAEETRALIQQVPATYHTQIDEVLLAALARSFNGWGVRRLLVDVEGHGREEELVDLNLARTVGWFTAVYPLLFETGAGAWPDGLLKDVKERVRAVPRRGVGYGILRYLGAETSAARLLLRALPAAEVCFNYLGQLDQVLAGSDMFGVAGEAVGASQSPREHRRHLLDISASVLGGRLRIIWTYSENIHRRATVERLADAYTGALRDLITHGRSGEAQAVTPSDFPLAKLDRNKLNKLNALINKRS